MLCWHEMPQLDPSAFPDYERAILARASMGDVSLGFARLGPCAFLEAFDDPHRSLRRSFVDKYRPIMRRRIGGNSLYMVLAQPRAAGIHAFLGVCCTEFFLKRDQAFIEAGLSALFIDVGGETCCTPRAEESAYLGQFTAEATLDPLLLDRVLRLGDTH